LFEAQQHRVPVRSTRFYFVLGGTSLVIGLLGLSVPDDSGVLALADLVGLSGVEIGIAGLVLGVTLLAVAGASAVAGSKQDDGR
jgi:hypothetical protein